MKRCLGLIAAVLLLTMPVVSWATGSCTMTAQEQITIDGKQQRIYLTLTCTGDAGGIAAYSLNPVTYKIRGWYLYNVTTDPGAAAPTDNYGITLVVAGEDIAGARLASRSTNATQTVVISDSTRGYHMMDGTMVITFASETANPATIVMTLRFTSN